jgi:hypothetical protein
VSLACLALVLPPPTHASRDEQDRERPQVSARKSRVLVPAPPAGWHPPSKGYIQEQMQTPHPGERGVNTASPLPPRTTSGVLVAEFRLVPALCSSTRQKPAFTSSR